MESQYQMEGSSSTFTQRVPAKPKQRCLQTHSNTGVWEWEKSLCKCKSFKTVQSWGDNVRSLAEKWGDELRVCPQNSNYPHPFTTVILDHPWSLPGLQSPLHWLTFPTNNRTDRARCTHFSTKTNLRCNYYSLHCENEETGASNESVTWLPPSRVQAAWGHSTRAAVHKPGREVSPK